MDKVITIQSYIEDLENQVDIILALNKLNLSTNFMA